MEYRLHINEFTRGFWSFHTPVEDYPWLPIRTLVENSPVAGMDIMLEDNKRKHVFFDIIISDDIIKGNNLGRIELNWIRGDRENPQKGGNWYINENGQEGWLCPVLFDYFNPCPMKIYVNIVKHVKTKSSNIGIKQIIKERILKSKKEELAYLIPINEVDEDIQN